MKTNGSDTAEPTFFFQSRVVWICSKSGCGRQKHNGVWGPPQPIGPYQPRMMEMCDECRKPPVLEAEKAEPPARKVIGYIGGGNHGAG